MSDRRGPKISAQVLAAYVDGEVTPSESEIVQAELRESAAARRQLAELQRIRDALSSPVPELQGMDVAGPVRQAIERGLPPRRRPVAPRRMVAAACMAAAVTLAIVRRTGDVLPAAATSSEHEFRAKSAASTRPSPGRWAGIQAYYLAAGSAPQRLASQHLPADAGLLFSYTNIGPRPFEFLMIFVTDARGETRWCYPAYEHAGTNPGALRIRAGAADVPLDELSHLDVAPGPATLHALFMRRSLRVLDVEAWLDESRAPNAPPPWPDVLHQKLDIGVER